MKIYFRVEELRPDQRQYRQTELVLTPDPEILVSVEISDSYLDEDNDDIITLAGLKEIISQCDLVFMGTSRKQEFNEVEDDVEWEKP